MGGNGDIVAADPYSGAVKLASATGAELWRHDVSRETGVPVSPKTIAIAANGDVLIAGAVHADIDNDHFDPDFAVARLASASGVEVWRTVIDGTPAPFDPEDPHNDRSPRDEALAVTVDAAGNVLVAGYLAVTGNYTFAVVKLLGDDGQEAWRFAEPGIYGLARALAIDPAGPILVSGEIHGVPTVMKLASAGSPLWQSSVVGVHSGTVTALAIDGAGAAILAGGYDSHTGRKGLVAKFASADGAAHWQYLPETTRGQIKGLAVDAAGDVALVGTFVSESPAARQDFAVAKLDGTLGTERWRQVLAGDGGPGDLGLAATLVADGEVIAAGRTTAGAGSTATVARLAGEDGAVRWRVDAAGVASGTDVAQALVLDPTGDVVAVGGVENAASYFDFAVAKLGRGRP